MKSQHASPTRPDTEAIILDEIELDLNGNIKLAISPPSPRSVTTTASLMDSEHEDDDIVDRNMEGTFSMDSEAYQQNYRCGMMVCDSFTNLCSSTPRSALKQTYPGPGYRPSRSVSFNSVSVREHGITLGDHPSASSGPPVQLDWEPQNVSTMSLDDYETFREPRRKRRNLKLSFQEREEILQTNGFTMEQLKDAWMESQKVRHQRYETYGKDPFSSKMEEAWESACRKFNRLWTVQENTSTRGFDVNARPE